MQTESNRIQKNRLKWRCRRGMLELDLLLNSYLEIHYDNLDQNEQKDFENLLELPDQTLQKWLTGNELPEDQQLSHVVKAVRQYHHPET